MNLTGDSSSNIPAVLGQNSNVGNGVLGDSTNGEGVRGISHNPDHGGVVGVCDQDHGTGVFGICDNYRHDVAGKAVSGLDISTKDTGTAVFGESTNGEGVRGVSHNTSHAGVVGVNTAGGDAGFFDGHVTVTSKGTITCSDMNISNADCAEEFELFEAAAAIEAGTLMSFRNDGTLCPSERAYDNRVAGVISGAGDYKPGIVLDRKHGKNRVPIALMGKVFCKVDAKYSPIEVGDLLTTSTTPGHAMKATDPLKAFGSVIGKALQPQRKGRGMIPILVALQ
jgi:hypothetical protein